MFIRYLRVVEDCGVFGEKGFFCCGRIAWHEGRVLDDMESVGGGSLKVVCRVEVFGCGDGGGCLVLYVAFTEERVVDRLVVGLGF